MYRLESKIDTQSDEFKENFKRMKAILEEYKEKLALIQKGGPEKYRNLHKSRKKLLVRERLEKLLDRNTPFLELTPLAAYDIYDNEAPSAGVITGIGVVRGREVLVVANDATVKGGTYFPMTIKKHVRAQEVALKNRLPCIYLVDSGGIFLPRQSGTFPDKGHFGRIFYNQARLSALGIPQISIVMGSCTAGGAYVPAMSDETVIVRQQGTIFIGGPPLVKAATGEEVSDEDLGGADVHCRISGVSDYYALNDEHALEICRNIVETLDPPKRFQLDMAEPEDPYYDPEEIYGIIPTDLRKLCFDTSQRLNLTIYTAKQAMKIIQDAKDAGLTMGKSPRSLVGAAIYMAAVKTGERRTQAQVAKAARTTAVTIRNRTKEIANKLGLDIEPSRGVAAVPVYVQDSRELMNK